MITDLVEKPVPGYGAEPVDRDRPVRLRPRGLRHPARDAARAAAGRSSSPTRSRCWPARASCAGCCSTGGAYDTGNKLDYLRTMVMFAAERPDLASEFIPWLRKYLEGLAVTRRSRRTTGPFIQLRRGSTSRPSWPPSHRCPRSSLTLADAEGCVLAEDVTAAVSLPSFDNSSMDGYAVHAKDNRAPQNGRPRLSRSPARSRRATPAPTGLSPGTAIKIMTGAQMPAGADAVVPVEWTDGGIARVAGLPPGRAGQRGSVRGRRRRRRRDAAVGRGADAADADRGGRVGGAQGGHGPAQAAGRRAVHRATS